MNVTAGSSQNRAGLLTAEGPYDHAYFLHLRRRLRWQLLPTYVVPLILLSVVFHYHYTTTLREGIHNHLRSVAENRRNMVDLYLKERVTNLRNVFRSEDLPIPAGPADMERVLTSLRRESPTYVDLGLFREDGTLVAYAGPHASLLGKDYSREEWFARVRALGGAPYISDVFLGFRGKPHIIVALSRSDEQGFWVLRASVDPEMFGEIISRSFLLAGAEAFIVNEHGVPQTFAGDAKTAPWVSEELRRSPDTDVSEAVAGRRKYIRALAWLTENDWAMMVRMPQDQAYGPLRQARLVLVAMMLLALLVIAALVLQSTRYLVGRLESAYTAKESLRRQLFTAAKLASVGEMAAGVAHEINNPLGIVYEEASLLLDLLDPRFGQGIDPAELKERLGAIQAAALRGRGITQKLLAFSRQHDSQPEDSDINALLERALAVKKNDFALSNIEVRRDLSPDLPCVCVNANQMDQVFLNLLNNARDAIRGSGRITVRTKLVGDWVHAVIGDSGCGMSPEVMDRIFVPFFTTKPVGKGTGLGLSISHGIVSSFGGHIEVRSEVGKGTEISIRLPGPEERKRRSGERSV